MIEEFVEDGLPRLEARFGDSSPVCGITTRALNFGLHTADPAKQVEAAHRALRAWAGARFRAIVGGSQVHGARLFCADGVAAPGDVEQAAPFSLRVASYDGFYSRATGVLLTIGVADCVPAVLWAPREGALAVLHAGWRGVAAEILPRALAALSAAYGVDPAECHAWWGPAVGACHYPVGDEVVAAIRATSAGPGEEAWVEAHDGPPRVDLRAALTRQAVAAGLSPERVFASPWCTACESIRFHSYRRESGGGGRMLAFAGVPLCGRVTRGREDRLGR